jgi:uncharacterized protein (TIGR02246 family)
MTNADDLELTHLFRRMCQSWLEGDAVAYGSCFTEDCDYVSFDGTRAQGRAAMVEAHDRLFGGVLFGSALVGEVETIRYLGEDVALLYGTGSVLVAWRTELPKRRLTRNTIVAVRTTEGWRFTAIHNGRVRPMAIPAPDSAVSRMARLMVRTSSAAGLGRAGRGA